MDPRYHTSSWEATSSHKPYPTLQHSERCDVVVIGAGITGLTAALHLKQLGKRVVVIDSKRVGSGTTGGTSAHLSTFYDQDYYRIEKAYGKETVALVAASMRRGLALIAQTVRERDVSCDYLPVPAYQYAESADEVAELAAEYSAAKKAGLSVSQDTLVPLPFALQKGWSSNEHAQFHPLLYLQALASFVDDGYCRVFEHSAALKIDEADDGRCIVHTQSGQVEANALVMATHTPLGISILQTQLAATRSYILAFTSSQALPNALFYDSADPYHYIRSQDTPQGRLIIVGGADRRVAHGDEQESFRALEAFARNHFEVNEVVWRWSSQFYESADLLPFIGLMPGTKHQYTGTGYSGDGLVFGSLAGWMIAQQITGHETDYDELYRPGRFHLRGLGDMMAVGLDGVVRAATDRLPAFSRTSAAELNPGEGAIVDVGLHKVAAYRDDGGTLHEFSAVCPHLQAIVHWNGEHKTFDCPWHGSRFDGCGEAVEGPCTAPLTALKYGNN